MIKQLKNGGDVKMYLSSKYFGATPKKDLRLMDCGGSHRFVDVSYHNDFSVDLVVMGFGFKGFSKHLRKHLISVNFFSRFSLLFFHLQP